MAETLSSALPDDIDALAAEVLATADKGDIRIATAESCTGGMLAALLTDTEGYGHVFDRAFVVYSPAAKCHLLALERGMVESCKGVSREVALAMAHAALERSGADRAVAITGFAGPGGPEDETGLVHIAVARSNGPPLHRKEHFGDVGRGPTRVAALRSALELLREAL